MAADPLRDAAQALLTAWDSAPPLNWLARVSDAVTELRAATTGDPHAPHTIPAGALLDRADALRAALAAADTTPPGLAQTELDLSERLAMALHAKMTAGPASSRQLAVTAIEFLAAAADTAPVRSCCGQPHTGAECPDGLVSCCLCFERVPKDRLHLLPNGARENVCDDCAAADGTTPTQPDEVLVWEGAFGQLAASLLGGPKYSERGWDPDQRVRVVATPATEGTHG